MTTSNEQGSPRARHLLRRYLAVSQIPQQAQHDYITQAAEVRAERGDTYLEDWLQGWIDDVEADRTAHAARSQARVDAQHAAIVAAQQGKAVATA
jgi:hypothetical protein